MPKIERVVGVDLAPRERPPVGAVHQLVAVPLDPAVDRVGATGGHGAARDHREDEPQRREPALGEEHRRHRDDEQQLDDAGFGQPQVRAERRDQGSLRGIEVEGGLSHGKRREGYVT